MCIVLSFNVGLPWDLYLSVHFNGHFTGETGLAGVH